ncbi:hypothetical protein AX16_003155 [Volvariella volvacea WC 439]|nr:hypothetical protein AX16_003155 [Volvariella volvacea WC 439]
MPSQPLLGSLAVQAPSLNPQIVHVSPSTCHDLTLFKEILKEYRRLDDTIMMRLNRANAAARDKDRTQDVSQGNVQDLACTAIWRELVENWKRRTMLVNYCVNVVDQSLDEKRRAMQSVTEDARERRRMQGEIYADEVKRNHVHNELTVESIVMKRSLEGQCRCTTVVEHGLDDYNGQRSARDVSILPRHSRIKKVMVTCTMTQVSENLALTGRMGGIPSLTFVSMHRLYSMFSVFVPVALAATPPFLQQDTNGLLVEQRVPVELGVMSRCPDGLLCESIFNEVLKRVANKVDISLLYIGKIDPTDTDFGVKCLHGPEECAGNVQQLCVAKYASPSNWWEFVQCQNYEGRDKIGLPDLALKCARTAEINWEESGVGECAGITGDGRGAEGIRLLQKSVNETQRRGIVKSCTILINGRLACIHDGSWQSCEGGHTVKDFVRQINEEYDRLNST